MMGVGLHMHTLYVNINQSIALTICYVKTSFHFYFYVEQRTNISNC